MDIKPICFSIDDNYAQHAGVVITSIIKNSSGLPNSFKFYIVDVGISDINKNKLCALVNQSGALLVFIKPHNELKMLHSNLKWISSAVYCKLTLPDIVKEKEIICLDADLIVNADILELMQQSPKDKLLLAAPESIRFSKASVVRLGIPQKIDRGCHYFNAGVMIINCEKWRKIRATRTVIQYLNKNDKLPAMEQDGLNKCFFDDWSPLDLAWNVHAGFSSRAKHMDLSKKDLGELRRHPKIIHFIGSAKSWHFENANPFKNLYWKYLTLTPWADYSLPPPTLQSRIRRIYFMLVEAIDQYSWLFNLTQVIPLSMRDRIKHLME